MSKILVTGGAGYIGSHFCASLDRSGYDYVVLDNLSRGNPASVDRERLIVGDIGDGPLVTGILREHGIDSVVHFAAFAYVGESTVDPATYYENNVVKGFHFMEAVRRAGVTNVIFSSSCTTYGNARDNPISESAEQLPTNPYGDTKLAFERLLKSYANAYAIRYALLRYFNAAGAHPELVLYEAHDPETHLIPLVIRAATGDTATLRVYGNDYPTADGTCVRDYIHVDDLASAHIGALQHLAAGGAPLALNLGIGRGYSVLEVIASAERLCGTPVRYEIAARRPGDPPVLVADATNARQILQWRPQYESLDAIVATALAGERRRVDARGLGRGG